MTDAAAPLARSLTLLRALQAMNAESLDALLAQVQAAQATPTSPPDPPAPADEPGFCYLNLYRPEARNRARAHLGAFPLLEEVQDDLRRASFGVADPGPFELQLVPTPRGVLAHVTEPRGLFHSARDVLEAVPAAARLGAVDLPEADVRAPPTSPGVPLGQASNPLQRRFMWHALTFSHVERLHATCTIDPRGALVTAYAGFSDYAAFKHLRARILPAEHSMNVATRLNSAWHPLVETSPTDAAGFAACPTFQAHMLQAETLGGAAPSLDLECPFTYGCQRIFKPTVTYGAAPHLALSFTAWRHPSGTVAPKQRYYDVFIEATVVLDPSLL